jgi:hypothetical protein
VKDLPATIFRFLIDSYCDVHHDVAECAFALRVEGHYAERQAKMRRSNSVPAQCLRAKIAGT